MARPEPVCVYCRRRRVDPAWRPFCSERCKLTDLGRWLSEGYRVPGERPRNGAPANGVHDVPDVHNGSDVDNDE